MSKVICFENNLGGVSIISPAPEMFDVLSTSRWDMRQNGVDFADGVRMMTWITGYIQSTPEGEQPPSFPQAINAYIASDDFKNFKGEADDAILAWVAAKDVPAGKSFEILELEMIPQDRYFRDAWKFNPGNTALEVDMEKAKGIQLDKIRQARNPLFDSADVDFNKSLEKVMGKLTESMPQDADVLDLKAKIDKRNALRDATKVDLSQAATPDELKATLPDILK